MKLYDPALVKLTVCGCQIGPDGFAPGTFIEVAQNEADFVLIMGIDGQGTRIRTENLSGVLRIHLMQTSDSNAILSTIRMKDVYSDNGASVGPTQINDLNGQTAYFAERSWIQKPPDGDFANVSKIRTWVIESDEVTQFVGGANYL